MTNLKLPIQKLREFLLYSKYIKTDDSILPVLKYIKVEIEMGFCFLTKSNNNSFCKFVFDVQEDDCEFLISEEKLALICDFGKTEYVDISIQLGSEDGDLMHLSSGRWKQEVNLSGANINEFPKIPDTSNSRISIGNDILECLKSAKVHAGKDKLVEWFTAVYLKGYDVFSSNGYAVYCKTFINELPSIGLTQMECDMLSSFNEILYSKCENYNTYKVGSVVYGFIQPEGFRGFDHRRILDCISKDNYIVVNREDFIAFCDSTIKFSKDTFCRSKFIHLDLSKGKLSFDDRSKKEKNEIEIEITTVGDLFDFTFSPETWSLVLKSLDYEKICIGNECGQVKCFSLFNENDNSYLGIIQKISDI